MSTCFVAGIVKGLKEHNDATRHFGSLMAFTAHWEQAEADGVVTTERDPQSRKTKRILTDKGRDWYERLRMKDLQDCRSYFWTDQRNWKEGL